MLEERHDRVVEKVKAVKVDLIAFLREPRLHRAGHLVRDHKLQKRHHDAADKQRRPRGADHAPPVSLK
ncbi:MAG: hypothetical protein M5R36_19500 [Deltaproteobacteria bacterium]|nr:hypothetical protein [Deltaproteobacteria bacterium]